LRLGLNFDRRLGENRVRIGQNQLGLREEESQIRIGRDRFRFSDQCIFSVGI